ncbi:uncharacterized protein LOC141679674 [Apium graveolens]|uniref:uncharacterized protein LOC141679674 n=1 Tax=Apium graveolens TaxID=4045 RepID=UPI003D79B80A
MDFKGEVDPIAARIWLKEIEKAFTFIQVNDDLKADYASYFLKGEANYWWESTRALEKEGPVPWTRFTELFLEKYFPDCLQNQLEVEFLELKEGERNSGDRVFPRLGKVPPHLLLLQLSQSGQEWNVSCVARGTVASVGRTFNVSNVIRTTCFECGKVGHISRNCRTATQGSIGGSASQGPASSTAKARTFKMTKRSNARDLDVVAGMDWLSQHKANINCKKKKILMFTEDNIRVNYQGQKQEKKFLSILKAKKLLRQGCEAYLYHIIDTEKEAPNMDEIPIVREFPDVFSDELPGLPPDCEIDFSIDLVPGAELVSKDLYHMAPVEMKELAKQLRNCWIKV